MVDLTSFAILSLVVAIFGLFVIAVRRGNTAAAINALGALVVALFPTVVEVLLHVVSTRSVSFGPVLPVWLAVAGFLHSLGMLGLYESTWWWDHLTHTVSAALVSALIYAGVLVTLPDSAGVGSSSTRIVAVTVVFTFAIGVVWELAELVARELGDWLDIDPVLVVYGWRDTAADLVFDVVGALLVLGFDLQVFVPIVEQFPTVTRLVLLGSSLIAVGGVVVMALAVGFADSIRS